MNALSPSATTILLVATSDIRRNVLAQQMEALGYSVIALPYTQTLPDLIKRTRYDLLVVDLSESETDSARMLAQYAAQLLAQGTPLLILSAEQQSSAESWTQETLGYRVAAALKNCDTSDVLSARAAHWEGLNVLDAETLFFSRRYFEAIFPQEMERAKRTHQPLTLLLLQINPDETVANEQWRLLSGRLLMSLRQTDILVRYSSHIILAMLLGTESAMARAVAARLIKTLTGSTNESALSAITIGLATYPQHGITPETLLTSARHALNHTIHPGSIMSFDQV